MLNAVLMVIYLFIQMQNQCGQNIVAPYNLFSVDLHICTFNLESPVISVGIYVFCQFTRWLPRLCFPHVSLFRRKACLSVHHRDFPLVDAVVVVDACTLFTTPIIVSARTCQQWQVPLWSWILRTRRVVSRKATYELHGVAANGQTIGVCMLCIIVMLLCL